MPLTAVMQLHIFSLVYQGNGCEPIQGFDNIVNLKVKYEVDAVVGGLCSPVSFVQHYGWKSVGLITEDNFICEYGARGIDAKLKEGNITVAEWARVPTKLSDKMITEYLERLRRRARIFAICHDNKTVLQRIMEIADHLGMTTNDYLYIYYSLIPNKFMREPWKSTTDFPATKDEIALRRNAFRVFRSLSFALNVFE
ncbi:hypothetical protein CAPTEDRAFT_218244 [Capitella teleta]|uniref:Receptor ligand binding region domain-containing protein n=1 Tax=Capitella teleta TaxID=283909 RepID=R7V510_CAPTE|nr:hypothetical protein CAPTEDRAFT_218244 [Capitella teleta]|eukprot:ELU13547.1 hypothetical protein CAPTEDRAFT_218244 [Capitella teleta]